jgi:Domain of unknown function (DUF4375)
MCLPAPRQGITSFAKRAMEPNHDFAFKLKIWDRIQNGIATQEEHALAMKWSEEYIASNAQGDVTPFHEQWRAQHDVYPFECWTDDGYDPTRSPIPRDIQLLSAMDYGKSDIDNGGFHQFFNNGTGVFALEMVEWCDRSGLNDVADVIRCAMKTLTVSAYPRSQEHRQRMLAQFPIDGDREQWDPFCRLDDKFDELLSNNGARYDDAADRWLRETCGIAQLDDRP